MPDRFDYQSLAARLLRGGIAPRRVRRIVGELREHFQDLRSDGMAEGMNDVEAASWASSRLGTEQQVANEMLARLELRSWAARWPWAFYALLPPCLMAALVVLVVLALGLVFDLYILSYGEAIEAGAPHTPHTWFVGTIDGILATVKYAAPVVLCATFCWMAVLRLSKSPWLIPGIVAAAFLGGSFDMYMYWGEDQWSMYVDFFLYPPYPNQTESSIRIAANLLLTLAPYLYWLGNDGGNQPKFT